MASNESELSRICTSAIAQLYPDYLLFLSLSGISLPGTITQKSAIITSLKREGFIKGIPDFSIMVPNGYVVHVELKHPNGKGTQSPSQQSIQQLLLRLGHNYYLEHTLAGVLLAMSNHISVIDRQSCFDQLVSTIVGTDTVLEPFMYFPIGTSIESIKQTLRSKYHLTNNTKDNL